MTQRQKHIQIPYVVNMHDRAAYDLHEIHPVFQQSLLYIVKRHQAKLFLYVDVNELLVWFSF